MNQNPLEKGPEQIPTKEEVLEVMARFLGNPFLTRELPDNKGLYLLEAQVSGKEPGEVIEYQYMRKGAFPDQNREVETSICAYYYQDGVPISEETIVVYRSGEWKDVREISEPGSKIEIKQTNIALTQLREAFDKKDIKLLRTMIDYIQEQIQKGDNMKCPPMTDRELENLLATGEGDLYVGTGTSGQRIFIKNGELWMPFTEGRDAELGKHYHLNFEYLFNIPKGEKLRVKF